MLYSKLSSNFNLNSSMAPSNIGLQFRGNWFSAKMEIVDEEGKFLKPSFKYLFNTNGLNNKRKFSLLVTTNSHCSPRETETTNGMKHVPLLENGSIDTEHRALVNFQRGRFVDDRFVYRQYFFIRSHEVGHDKTITLETLMNFLQETALNHVSSCGLNNNDFGASHEMALGKLIWVLIRIQVQVLRYCKWGDEIEVDTWIDIAGKNGTRKDWIVRDHDTKEIIAKATSTWTMMNRETRTLSKIPEDVRQEFAPFYFNRHAIAREEIDHQKIHKLNDATAESFAFMVTPGWYDMDANQHVNNVKYLRWIIESVPREVLKDYKMTNMTSEFRRECTQSNLLESIASPSSNVIGAFNNNSVNRKPELQYIHVLRLKDSKAELVRARTEWQLKHHNK